MFVLVVLVGGGKAFCCEVCVCLLLFGCRLSLWPTLQLVKFLISFVRLAAIKQV